MPTRRPREDDNECPKGWQGPGTAGLPRGLEERKQVQLLWKMLAGPLRLTTCACGEAAIRASVYLCVHAADCSLGGTQHACTPLEVALPLKQFCSTRPGSPGPGAASVGQWDSGQGEVSREHGHQAEAEGGKAQRSRSGVRTADRKPAGGHSGRMCAHPHTPTQQAPDHHAHTSGASGASTPKVFLTETNGF